MNSKVIQAADQMSGTISNMRGLTMGRLLGRPTAVDPRTAKRRGLPLALLVFMSLLGTVRGRRDRRADPEGRHLSRRRHPRRDARGQPGRRNSRRRRPLRRGSRARRRQGGAADPSARTRHSLRGRVEPQACLQRRGSEAHLRRGRAPHHDGGCCVAGRRHRRRRQGAQQRQRRHRVRAVQPDGSVRVGGG